MREYELDFGPTDVITKSRVKLISNILRIRPYDWLEAISTGNTIDTCSELWRQI